MRLTKQQKDIAARARQCLRDAVRSAANVSFYRTQAMRHEGGARDGLLDCAVTARKGMLADLQRITNALEALADLDGAA